MVEGYPLPFTGDGFVIETRANGKLSVYFKQAVMELHKSADTDVKDIIDTCVEMAALQHKLSVIWQEMNAVGVAHGFQLTEAFRTHGFGTLSPELVLCPKLSTVI